MPPIEKSRPAYQQIYEHYERLISEGRLTQGQRVDSAREISEQWGVSVATAARALRLLWTARLVYQSHRGTFVAPGRLVPGPQHRYELAELPAAERIRVLSAELVEHAPSYVRPILGLEDVPRYELCPVIRREQVHYGPEGRPVLLMVEWLPPRYAEACPELLVPEPLAEPGGAIRLIEARTGELAVRGRESHEARQAQDDDREIPLLELPLIGDGSAVLGQVWVWYSATDAMAYTEMTLPEGRVISASFSASR